MKHQLLCLRQAQLKALASSISDLTYSDSDMTNFRDNLVALCSALQEENVKDMSDEDKHEFYNRIENIVVPWVNSYRICNEGNLHREMFAVVKQLITDWIPNWDSNQFLILSEGSYSINRLSHEDYAKLNAYKNVSFKKLMIDVKLPKTYNDNLLYNSSLFHEIGHLIVVEFNIAQKVFERIDFDNQHLFNQIVSQSFVSIVHNNLINHIHLKSLIVEYICDLFGAQYVGEKINHYAEYIFHDNFDNKSNTHPTVNERIKMIADFMYYCENGVTDNILLKYIIEEFQKLGEGKELKIRYQPFDTRNLLVGDSISLKNNDEVYSLFHQGWEHFLKGPDEMSALKGYDVSNTEFYDTIVNAMRKSLAEYFGIS